MSMLPPDFRAHVSFVPQDRGGRKTQPVQGFYRPDIQYLDDIPKQAWMVWPIFLRADYSELESGEIVPIVSEANFYIVAAEMRREVHAERAAVGVKFNLVEGNRVVALCEIAELLALHDNMIV